MEHPQVIRPYPCTMCNLAFKSKQFLQRHMASHSDDRNYSCSICENTYKYRKGLNRHIKKIHKLGVQNLQSSIKKQFKVEDFLDLANEAKYQPKKYYDLETGKEVQILFTWINKKTS